MLGIHKPAPRADSVIFCSTANILGSATEFSSIVTLIINSCGTPSLVCIAGSHLLIHLKEAGQHGTNWGTSYRPRISSINFYDEGHEVPGDYNM